MRVEIVDEAEQDLVDGARFYELQDPGLGEYFLDSLFSDVDSLQLYAGIHPVHFGYHRLLSKRFPYAVYYRVEGSVAQVWAVLDCRQDPEKIEKRLTQDRGQSLNSGIHAAPIPGASHGARFFLRRPRWGSGTPWGTDPGWRFVYELVWDRAGRDGGSTGSLACMQSRNNWTARYPNGCAAIPP